MPSSAAGWMLTMAFPRLRPSEGRSPSDLTKLSASAKQWIFE